MAEFLIQDKTDRVYVRTDALAARKDMKPYSWPKQKKVKTKKDGATSSEGDK